MLIHNDKKFIQANFENEDELERIVLENYEYIFGPGSFYLPKAIIKTREGVGTIPDGYAIDLSSRRWFIVEVELARHSVWNHIAPQISKQIIAAQQELSRKLLVEIAVSQYKDDDSIKDIFSDLNISELDVRKVLTEILETTPLIGLPIDSISPDLKDWARTLKNDVRLWTIKKYIEFGSPQNIVYEFPEEYKPVLDTQEEKDVDSSGQDKATMASYDVTVFDLITAGLLNVGDKIRMSYKPRNGDQRNYEGMIEADGSISVLGKKFSSLSYAALFGIQEAGSDRKTVNGWTSWRTLQGDLLADVRDKYLDAYKQEN
ncbi:MAG: hypothetical protein AB1393_05135 [Candidatus Edwardsbacteria bacterium]